MQDDEDDPRWETDLSEANQLDGPYARLALDLAIRPRRESKLDTWKRRSNQDDDTCDIRSVEPVQAKAPSMFQPALAKQQSLPAMHRLFPTTFSLPHESMVSFYAAMDLEPLVDTCMYFEVEFKRCRRTIFMGHVVYTIGDYVKVEADRGHDVGRIARQVNYEVLASRSAHGPLKHILRKASHTELQLLACKMEEEAIVLNVCRLKVQQRALPMQVVDAEFQFDRHKLTFYFYADRRIDFRELVRDLFATYKTRIWLQHVVDPTI
ncbi:hypothetical protein AC1031_005567 [Aphanomyces cochlioides]|nr:hypothetical protein AC1031_005567 [Aphanomyces cochlioides]